LALEHYVDRLKDENDELRKMMGWLSAHEPQLKMMIEAYKLYDGQFTHTKQVGRCAVERDEKIGDIPIPPQTTHRNTFQPIPNHLRNELDTTPDPPVSPPQTNEFPKPVKFVSAKGDVVGEKEG
jgi:hypothetical protein